MTVIRDYEEISGQMVNKAKSAFYLHDKTPLIVAIRMRKLTGIRQGNFPFIYLGCPIFYGRKINSHFEDLVRKVARRILSWQNKFLSFGGKYILIIHILQSLPVYLLSAMNPPKKIIAQLHQIFAKFFWGNTCNIKGKHWVAWSDMCYPKAEGGLVKEFIENGSWKIEKLQEHISEEMISHIVKNIQPHTYALNDKLWWMGNSIGVFSAKSAYHLLRNKRDTIDWMSCIWIKGLPFKFSFFLWRVWKKRIATDDNLRRIRIHIVSKCYCCEKGELETMTHLLLTAPITQRLWKQFASCAGLNIDGIHLHHLLIKWWKYEGNPKLQQIMKAIPAIVTWELWKMRNSIRHDKKVSFDKMFSQCQIIVHRLIKANYPWLKNIPLQWSGMFDLLQRYRPTLFYHIVRWTRPKEGWVKCNTDGASRGNPGMSSYGFCLRDSSGDLLYAEAKIIGFATNMVAEITTIWKAMRYCKEQGYANILLETDSLSLKNMIRGEWKIPWKIIERVEEIHEMMEISNTQIRHIYREANQLADFITNTTIDQEGKLQYHGFYQLPSKARGILNMDKQQIAAIRIRTRRINITNSQ
ncbi:hypothetical protein MTR67_024399 [Solanum verrucosum]|uniref:RNase H type-1 domain-containing protein n=1 Tax=Solanum verrucosum TaxID=315347 RepID=A0AAF0TSY6_SOLVR|nr:hypothetical protein MTR67_024399 [Solanum verrucosum]